MCRKDSTDQRNTINKGMGKITQSILGIREIQSYRWVRERSKWLIKSWKKKYDWFVLVYEKNFNFIAPQWIFNQKMMQTCNPWNHSALIYSTWYQWWPRRELFGFLLCVTFIYNEKFWGVWKVLPSFKLKYKQPLS